MYLSNIVVYIQYYNIIISIIEINIITSFYKILDYIIGLG